MSTATTEIPRDSWRGYFDEFSKALPTVEATIEVVGPDVGDQIEAERLVLTGITYDNKDDILVVGLDAPGGSPEELQHIIYGPQTILATGGAEEGELLVFDVMDGEGRQHLLRIENAPRLPDVA
jgi:hypothetical protein